MSFASMIEAGNVSVFAVQTQTSKEDRWSLLQLQRLVRSAYPGYSYLEVGSYLGGTIFPHLVDHRCASIVSVDLRPDSQPDERGRRFVYEQISTKRMLDKLASVAGEPALAKLKTFDADISAVDPKLIGRNVRLALIDAEHTDRAAFRDFTRVLGIVEKDAIIAFHDSNVLIDALWNIETFLTHVGLRHRGFYLPSAVYAVALGKMVDPATAALQPYSLDPEAFYRYSKDYLIASAKRAPPVTPRPPATAVSQAVSGAPLSIARARRLAEAALARGRKSPGPWHAARRASKRLLRAIGLLSPKSGRKWLPPGQAG